MSDFKIYGLFDPRPEKHAKCFYVGQTKGGLTDRLYQHCTHKGENNYKENVINKIVLSGLKPVIIEIDSVNTKEECNEKEIYWINYFETKLGCELTNVDKTGNYQGYKESTVCNIKRKQYTLHGEYVSTYNSCADAVRSIMNGNQKYETTYRNINDCCNNKKKSAYGYQWCNDGDEQSILTDATIIIKHKEYNDRPLYVVSRTTLNKIARRRNNIQFKIRLSRTHLPDSIEAKRLNHLDSMHNYQHSDRGKEAKRNAMKTYRQTEEGKRKDKEYKQSEHYKELARQQKIRAKERI